MQQVDATLTHHFVPLLHSTPCLSLGLTAFQGIGVAGMVYQILKNWPERRIKAICITDGERVGHLGDLVVQVLPPFMPPFSPPPLPPPHRLSHLPPSCIPFMLLQVILGFSVTCMDAHTAAGEPA